MYATVDDLRTERLLDAATTTERATRALGAASSLIDAVTGQFFEPRTLSVSVVGRGAPTVWLPVPILRLDRLEFDGREYSTDPSVLEVVGGPVVPGLDGPRLTRLVGVFNRGRKVRIDGVWGYTEPDGSPLGHTPYSIWRACLLLAARVFLPLAGDPDNDARMQSRIVEQHTRDQGFRLAEPIAAGVIMLTGDAEVDLLLSPYLRRPGMGAA